MDHPADVVFAFLTAFHELPLPTQSCLQYAMFPCRLQPEMCRVETFVPCTARRSVVCSRQTERFLPRRSGCLGPDVSRGLFLWPVKPTIKKERILFEAGLAPLSAPALYILLPHLDDRRQKEHSAEAECSSFWLFCFGWLAPNQAAFLALACAASALLPSTTRSMARMTSRMARIARM